MEEVDRVLEGLGLLLPLAPGLREAVVEGESLPLTEAVEVEERDTVGVLLLEPEVLTVELLLTVLLGVRLALMPAGRADGLLEGVGVLLLLSEAMGEPLGEAVGESLGEPLPLPVPPGACVAVAAGEAVAEKAAAASCGTTRRAMQPKYTVFAAPGPQVVLKGPSIPLAAHMGAKKRGVPSAASASETPSGPQVSSTTPTPAAGGEIEIMRSRRAERIP